MSAEESLKIFIYRDKSLDMTYIDKDGNEVALSSTTWVKSTKEGVEEIQLDVAKDYFSVYLFNATTGTVNTVAVSKFSAAFPVGKILAWGPDEALDSGDTFCTAGYVEANTNTWSPALTYTISFIISIVPLLIIISVVGMIVKILDLDRRS